MDRLLHLNKMKEEHIDLEIKQEEVQFDLIEEEREESYLFRNVNGGPLSRQFNVEGNKGERIDIVESGEHNMIEFIHVTSDQETELDWLENAECKQDPLALFPDASMVDCSTITSKRAVASPTEQIHGLEYVMCCPDITSETDLIDECNSSNIENLQYFEDNEESLNFDATLGKYSGFHTELHSVQNILLPRQKKKKLRKRHFCLYCEARFYNLTRHLIKKHKDKEPVAQYLSLLEICPRESRQNRREIFDKLRQEGNIIYREDRNKRVKNNEVVPINLPTQVKNNLSENYVTCAFCRISFSRKTFCMHVSECATKKNEKKSSESEYCVSPSKTMSTNMKISTVMSLNSTPSLVSKSNLKKIKYSEEMENNHTLNINLTSIETNFCEGYKKVCTKPQLVQNSHVTGQSKKNNRHFCLYCKVSFSNFRKHLITKHKDKTPVAQYLLLLKTCPKESKLIRKEIFDDLRFKGNFIHNEYILKDLNKAAKNLKKAFSEEPTIVKDISPNFHITCNFCQGLFYKNDFDKHVYKCFNKGKSEKYFDDNNCNSFENPESCIPSMHHTNDKKIYGNDPQSPETLIEIKEKIRIVLEKDNIGKAALADKLIMSIISDLSENHMIEKDKCNVIQKLLDAGALLLKLREVDPTIKELKDLFTINKVGLILTTVQVMCRNSKYTGKFGIIGMPERLLCIINDCAARVISNIMSNESLTKEKQELLKTDVNDFLAVIKRNWKYVVLKASKFETNQVADSVKTNELFQQPVVQVKAFEEDLILKENSDTENNLCNNSIVLASHHKKRWTNEEKSTVINEFKDFIISKTNPGLIRCRELIAKEHILSGRTSAQVNSFIDNINKNKLKLPLQFEHLKSQALQSV